LINNPTSTGGGVPGSLAISTVNNWDLPLPEFGDSAMSLNCVAEFGAGSGAFDPAPVRWDVSDDPEQPAKRQAATPMAANSHDSLDIVIAISVSA
jgi:hypothetical protein